MRLAPIILAFALCAAPCAAQTTVARVALAPASCGALCEGRLLAAQGRDEARPDYGLNAAAAVGIGALVGGIAGGLGGVALWRGNDNTSNAEWNRSGWLPSAVIGATVGAIAGGILGYYILRDKQEPNSLTLAPAPGGLTLGWRARTR
jgi:hypothetical protein